MRTEAVTASESAIPSAKTGTWWFLASEIPVFGGLIASYVVLRIGGGGWTEAVSHVNFGLGLVNTFLLLTSSMTIVMAFAAMQDNNPQRAGVFLGLTVLLGLGFLVIKAIEYSGEITHGFLPSSGIFWSFYYGMTGLHALHVLAGITVNLVLSVMALRGSLAQRSDRVEAAGLYWHFVDIVWIFLFPLLYLS